MRTDTRTFERRVLKAVRALGVNARRSKIVAARIVCRVRNGSYLDRSETGRATLDSIELSLHMRSADVHMVDVRLDGEYAWPASTPDMRLVSTEATPRQIELRDEMISLAGQIRDLRQGVTMAALDADGAPDFSVPDVVVLAPLPQDAPEIRALLARHDDAQAESLAINPHADATVLDPELADVHYECCKDEGWRPRGYRSLASVRSFLERRRDEDDLGLAT